MLECGPRRVSRLLLGAGRWQIEKDLLRTMPSNACFASVGSVGVPRLRRVLRALAWLYPEIGYCQGTGMVSTAREGLQVSPHMLLRPLGVNELPVLGSRTGSGGGDGSPQRGQGCQVGWLQP